METTAVGQDPGAAGPTPEESDAIAELEAVFGEALGSVVLSIAMNNVATLNESLSEIRNDE